MVYNKRKPTKKKSKEKNPNLRTKAWGPPAWFYITCALMGYPEKNATPTQRKTYKNFLIYVGKTLPCNLCRDSYAKYIKELPLTCRVLSGRKSLVMWFFRIHNKVNKKLKCKQLTRKQMEAKYRWYNNFRAVSCSPDLGGCLKATEKVKKPKRTKVIMFVDEKAVALRKKDKKAKDKKAKDKKAKDKKAKVRKSRS